MDTESSRIPNWNARKASSGVRSVRGSPVMNIKSLGDKTNKPARASNLAHERSELPAGKYQGDGTDRANAANDQVVMIPSASSESITAVDCAVFWGLSDMSRSSKLSAIWNEVGKLEVVAMDQTVTGDGALKRSRPILRYVLRTRCHQYFARSSGFT